MSYRLGAFGRITAKLAVNLKIDEIGGERAQEFGARAFVRRSGENLRPLQAPAPNLFPLTLQEARKKADACHAEVISRIS
jgi:hypothetical protein